MSWYWFVICRNNSYNCCSSITNKKTNIKNKDIIINSSIANKVINPILDWVITITETELTDYLQNANYSRQISEWISNLLNIKSIYLLNISFVTDDQNYGNAIVISPSQYLTFKLDNEINSSDLKIYLNDNGELVIGNLKFVSLINLTQNNIELFATTFKQKISSSKISQNYFLNQINKEIIYQQIYSFFSTNNSGDPINQYDYIQEIFASNNVVTIIPKKGNRFNIISNFYSNNDVAIINGNIVINNIPFINVIENNIINLSYRSLANAYNSISSQTPNLSINQAVSLINEPSNQTQIIKLITFNIDCEPSYIDKVELTKNGILNIIPANGYEFKLNDDLSNDNTNMNYDQIFSSIKLNDYGNLIFSKLVFNEPNTIVVDVEKYWNLNNKISNAKWPNNLTFETVNNTLNQDNTKNEIATLLGVNQNLIEKIEISISSWGDCSLNIIFQKNYFIVFNNTLINIDTPNYVTPKLQLNNKNIISFNISSTRSFYNSLDINKLSEQISLIDYTNGGGVFTAEYFNKSSSQINGYNGGILKYRYDSGYDIPKYTEFCNLIGLDTSVSSYSISICVDNQNYLNVQIISMGGNWDPNINFEDNGIGLINGNTLTYKQKLSNLNVATDVNLGDANIYQWEGIGKSEVFLKYNSIEEIENILNDSQYKQTFLNNILFRSGTINANQVESIKVKFNDYYDGLVLKDNPNYVYEQYDVIINPVKGVNFITTNSSNNKYYFENNGYLVIKRIILAKSNRIAIDTSSINNLVSNYNTGTSLLNNSIYFNSDGTVKQEYLPDFIKNLLNIKVYNSISNNPVNNRDELFDIVPALKNAFASLKVSSVGWNYNNFLRIRIDIQQPTSDYVLLPARSTLSSDISYIPIVNNIISYYNELPTKILIESSNLQKLADELRKALVNTTRSNFLNVLNNYYNNYYFYYLTKKFLN